MTTKDDFDTTISQLLLKAEQRLQAIESELAVIRINEAALVTWIKRTNNQLFQINNCLVDNDMASWNLEPPANTTENENATPCACTVHHLNPKEPA